MEHLAGHYYHVYNRGCNRERIFTETDNYLYLLKLIKRNLPGASVHMTAYCLMPNHYHFLMRCDADRGVGLFIQRLFNGYSQAFNRRNNRSGTLFEGRSKSIMVTDERYVMRLCGYIHLNPVVAGLVSAPEKWPYSNYQEWIAERAGSLIDREFISMYFHGPDEYKAFIESSVDEAMARKMATYCLD